MSKRIRFLFDGNFEIQNKVYPFRKGDVLDAPDEDADALILGKCAEVHEDKPKKAKKQEAETWQPEEL